MGCIHTPGHDRYHFVNQQDKELLILDFYTVAVLA
jgi:hypothetical protein